MIVVLGASGFLGQRFLSEMRGRGLRHIGLRRAQFESLSETGLVRELSVKRAEFVVNCAGYTGKPNVDACEAHKADCLIGNAALPGIVAKACGRLAIPWGHVSSGCIFDGAIARGDPRVVSCTSPEALGDASWLRGFTESDVPNFSFRSSKCSFYSGTKAQGEEVIGAGAERGGGNYGLAEGVRAYIWRPRIPFDGSDSPRNYLVKLMHYPRLLDARNSISDLDEFVSACVECFERRVPFGIYNMTNPGSITAREITEMMLEEGEARRAAGARDPFPERFDFFESEDEFMRRAALTPRSNCVLDSSKLSAVGIHMSPVREAVQRRIRELLRIG